MAMRDIVYSMTVVHSCSFVVILEPHTNVQTHKAMLQDDVYTRLGMTICALGNHVDKQVCATSAICAVVQLLAWRHRANRV